MSIGKGDLRDDYVFPDGTPLQVTRWTEQRAFVDFDGTTDRLIIPVGAEIIELSATENCFIHFGDVTVNATAVIATDGSRLFLAGVQVVPVPLDSSGDLFTHVAVIEAVLATPGTLQVEQVL